MKLITVHENEAGQRLDKLLTKYLNQAGKGFLYKMMRKKNITLNGKKCDGSEKLQMGDEVRLFLADETIEKFSGVSVSATLSEGQRKKLDILYEDSHILLINKPSGMLSQKARESDVSLVEYLLDYLLTSNQLSEESLKTFKPSICNRLDRNTSGIVVAGKSLPGLQIMAEIFKDRSLHKHYRCVVFGKVEKECRIEGYLSKNEKNNQVTISSKALPDSAPIVTSYKPLDYEGDYTLLSVTLITGRTHQIRAHLASIHHPIVGDYKYGEKSVNEKVLKEHKIRSQMLHSYEIQFPRLREPLAYLSGKEFSAPLPEEFSRICKRWK